MPRGYLLWPRCCSGFTDRLREIDDFSSSSSATSRTPLAISHSSANREKDSFAPFFDLQHFPLSPILSRDKIHTHRLLPPNVYLPRPRFWDARDQTRPGSLFSRSWGRGERDPGNEVGFSLLLVVSHFIREKLPKCTHENDEFNSLAKMTNSKVQS